MAATGPLSGWTRRQALGVLALQANTKLPVFPSEIVRFLDRATEMAVERLTDPFYSNFFPGVGRRGMARRGRFLLLCSDRTGSAQAFRMEEETGETRQLSDVQALDGSSLSLLPNDREACFFDGPILKKIAFSNGRTQSVYTVPDGWDRAPGFSVSEERESCILIERRSEIWRLRLVPAGRGSPATLLEAPEPLSNPLVRPGGQSILYRRGNGALWLVGSRGAAPQKLPLPEGEIGVAHWAPGGRSVLYLHRSGGSQVNLREFEPESGSDRLVAATSEFIGFGCNGDASVVVGASASKASPDLLLLLRSVKRELTLCEHRASAPGLVEPMFSLDGRRVYFQSDRHGKPAVYRINVDRLIEPIALQRQNR